MRRYFVFFLLSGFAGLVYETVWLRLAMAEFGVTAISLSIVLSVFMVGLALGSWLVARFGSRLAPLDARRAALLYAAAELAIAAAGFFVPEAFHALGAAMARGLRGSGPWAWHGVELVAVGIALLPACTAMGATLPLGVFALEREGTPARRFSRLYVANVLGAVLGTLSSAFVFIELWGFRGTLRLAAAANLLVAALCAGLARKGASDRVPEALEPAGQPDPEPLLLVALFFSGFCSMGLEVVWTRLYPPFVGTFVYSFASILAVYLASTFAGAAIYRALRPSGSPLRPAFWALVAVAASAPLLATDWAHFAQLRSFDESGEHRFALGSLLRVVLGVAPVSLALGFLTPHLVDRWSGGEARRTALAYAVNTLGCIIGPLLAGFALLPLMSERTALVLLCLPWLALGIGRLPQPALRRILPVAAASAVLASAALFTSGLEGALGARQVLRDHTATSFASGQGRDKHLLVNSVGMTILTPITKAMAHLPLAALGRAPANALVICFGMGTTFRSARSWGIPTTAVELVPGVPRLFGYFHADAAQVLAADGARIVIDDGRRYLDATAETFDVVILDPPPPVQAASSSLLYAREFYQKARAHMAPDGILAQWVPGADLTTLQAMTSALSEEFAHVRAFPGFEFGAHLIASSRPIVFPPASVLAARLPPAAQADFVEWGPGRTAEEQFQLLLRRELSISELTALFTRVPALSDDRPINEYDLLRTRFDAGPKARPRNRSSTASR